MPVPRSAAQRPYVTAEAGLPAIHRVAGEDTLARSPVQHRAEFAVRTFRFVSGLGLQQLLGHRPNRRTDVSVVHPTLLRLAQSLLGTLNVRHSVCPSCNGILAQTRKFTPNFQGNQGLRACT